MAIGNGYGDELVRGKVVLQIGETTQLMASSLTLV
jgi:hypothetical protein